MSESGDKSIRYMIEGHKPNGWRPVNDCIHSNSENANWMAQYYLNLETWDATRVVEMRISTFYSK